MAPTSVNSRRRRGGAVRPVLTVNSDLVGLLGIKHGRKSTPDPRNPGKSVHDQLGYLDIEFKRRGLVEAPGGRIEEDEQGASRWSKNTTREKFELMMALIRDQPIAVVAFWALNRGMRRQRVFGEFVELCQDRNVLILLHDQLYDPRDPNHLLTLGINAVVDEHQVARSRQDTLRGVASSAAAGRPHGPGGYGYRRVYDSRGQLERVEIHPGEAAVLREIRDRRLPPNPESSRAIVRDLNSRLEGLPADATPDHPDYWVRRPRGGQWHSMQVREILLEPLYYGQRAHTIEESGQTTIYTAMWPAIFAEEDRRVAERIFSETAAGPVSSNPKYLLTGIAICGRCDDRPMYVQPGRKYGPDTPAELTQGYTCPGCGRVRNRERLDQYVLDVLDAWLAQPEFRRIALGGLGEPARSADDDRLTELNQELDQLGRDVSTGAVSARLATIDERRLLGEIKKITDQRQANAARDGRARAMADYIAAGAVPLRLMDSVDARRRTIGAFVRVRCHAASRRGPGFDPGSVEVTPVE